MSSFWRWPDWFRVGRYMLESICLPPALLSPGRLSPVPRHRTLVHARPRDADAPFSSCHRRFRPGPVAALWAAIRLDAQRFIYAHYRSLRHRLTARLATVVRPTGGGDRSRLVLVREGRQAPRWGPSPRPGAARSLGIWWAGCAERATEPRMRRLRAHASRRRPFWQRFRMRDCVSYAGFGRARRARARVNRLCATVEHHE